ncbi:MAG: hypothetical protein EBZ48_01785 [Proteobacteria bacterium]|nr:hypothetical protein [Pseudomonadota bacterium]
MSLHGDAVEILLEHHLTLSETLGPDFYKSRLLENAIDLGKPINTTTSCDLRQKPSRFPGHGLLQITIAYTALTLISFIARMAPTALSRILGALQLIFYYSADLFKFGYLSESPVRTLNSLGLSLVTVSTVFCPTLSLAAPSKSSVVCVAPNNGTITVKSKCKSSESRLSEGSYSQGRSTTLYVAPKGAKFTSVFSAIGAAIGVGPTASNPILIKLAPGIYEETRQLSVPNYVTIEGSGVGVSTIKSSQDVAMLLGTSSQIRRFSFAHDSSSSATRALQIPSGTTEARIEEIAIILSGTSPSPVAIDSAGAGVAIKDTSIENTDASATPVGVQIDSGTATIEGLQVSLIGSTIGVLNTSGDLLIRNSSITTKYNTASDSASGIRIGGAQASADIDTVTVKIAGSSTGGNAAIYVSTSPNTIARNSSFQVTGFTNGAAVVDDSGELTVLNSDVITDASRATATASSSGILSIGNSRLSGDAANVSTGGTLRCAGVVDENFSFYASACP